MIDYVSTLPEKFCLIASAYNATYQANKVYLGRSNNLGRETYVTLSIIFKTLDEQKEFFDWWENETDSGGRPFYAKLPMYADEKYYLIAQSKPFTQIVDPNYKITGQFIQYENKTKDENSPPVAHDVDAIVDENSQNNMILLDITDVDNDSIVQVEIVNTKVSDIEVRGESVIYTPPDSFLGLKEFTYRAYDGLSWSNEATLSIYVKEVNAPLAYDMDISVGESHSSDTDKNYRYFELNAKDVDNRELTYTITDIGSTEGLSLISGDKSPWVRLSVKNLISGQNCNFKYKVNNGYKDSNEATVTVRVKASQQYTPPNLPSSVRVPATYSTNVTWVISTLEDDGIFYDKLNRCPVDIDIVYSPTTDSPIEQISALTNGYHAVPILAPQQIGLITSGENKDEDFQYRLEFKSHGADTKYKQMEVKVVDTTQNERCKNQYDENIDINIDPNSPHIFYFGLFNSDLYGYPMASDFPDVESSLTPQYDKIGQLVPTDAQGRFGDFFTKYKQLSAGQQGENLEIDDRGIIKMSLRDYTHEWDISFQVFTESSSKVLNFTVRRPAS